MKAAPKATLDQATKEVLEGRKTMREAMEAHGLNESQLWLHGQAVRLYCGQLTPITHASDTATGAQIVLARAAGESWGLIAVRAQMPESRVRRIFKDVAAIDSVGLRTGKGGRYVADDPRFYTGSDRAKLGTELDPAQPVLAQVPEADEPQVRNLPKVAQRVKRVRKASKKA